MSFWNNLKTKAQEMSDGLKTKVSQFKSNDFANASMAVCALIAAADGTIDPSERRKTAAFIGSSDVLSVFPVADIKAKFDEYCNKVEADFDFGKVDLLQVVGKLAKKPEQARAVIQIGIIIGGADGDFSNTEKTALKEICRTLNIPPSEYDLA
ncbi:MAG: TerB family tellurite resistance protein [Deinococcales bacterium]